jgi:hypothetical protein
MSWFTLSTRYYSGGQFENCPPLIQICVFRKELKEENRTIASAVNRAAIPVVNAPTWTVETTTVHATSPENPPASIEPSAETSAATPLDILCCGQAVYIRTIVCLGPLRFIGRGGWWCHWHWCCLRSIRCQCCGNSCHSKNAKQSSHKTSTIHGILLRKTPPS